MISSQTCDIVHGKRLCLFLIIKACKFPPSCCSLYVWLALLIIIQQWCSTDWEMYTYIHTYIHVPRNTWCVRVCECYVSSVQCEPTVLQVSSIICVFVRLARYITISRSCRMEWSRQMRGCGDYNNHHTLYIPAWLSLSSIKVRWVNLGYHGNCLHYQSTNSTVWRNLAILRMVQVLCWFYHFPHKHPLLLLLLLLLTLTVTFFTCLPHPPMHTKSRTIGMCNDSSLESAIKVVLHAVENINPAMCVGAVWIIIRSY